MKTVCSIYVYYNSKGRLEEYASYAIKELKKISHRVLVVVNGKLSYEARRLVTDDIGVDLLVRDNEGYDFTAYKEGIKCIGYDELKCFDRLILLNSSVYGPITSLDKLFSKMDGHEDIDFWGITKNKEEYTEHIQSYFIVFKNRVLKDPVFKKYWENLPAIHNRDEAIALGEAQLTKFFYDKGFKYDVVVPRSYEYFDNDTTDGMLYSLKYLESPFIKRNLFTSGFYRLWRLSSPNVTKETFELLSDDWKRIIYDDLLHNQPQSKWKLALQNTWILDNSYRCIDDSNIPSNAAVFFVWFKENIDVIIKYVSSLPYNSDIYFVSTKTSILELYRKKLKDEVDRKFYFRIQPNRGRNEACYWICCRDVIESHKFVCLIHDKKVVHMKPWSQGSSFFRYQLENLLSSKSYVLDLLKHFEDNSLVGLVQPPLPVFGLWAGTNVLNPKIDINNISGNTERCRKFLELNVPLDPELPYPVGGSFWIRSEAFKSLLEKQLQYEDFPEEPLPNDGSFNHALERIYPLIAQDAGFITIDVMTSEYAVTHKGNLELYIRLNQNRPTTINFEDIEQFKNIRWKILLKIFRRKIKNSIKRRFIKK